MVPMLRTLTKKGDNVQEQISNVKRKVKALRNYRKEMLEIKSTAREMKNAFDEPIRRLDRAKERTVSFKIRQQKLLRLKHKENKNKKQNKKNPKPQTPPPPSTTTKRTKPPRTVGQFQKMQHDNWKTRSGRTDGRNV